MTSGSSGYKTVSRYNVIGGNFGLFMASEAEKLLQELDILLENLSESSIPPIPPSDEERAKTYSEVSSRFQLVGEYVSEKISNQLKDKKSLTSFRVCSIGCGSGLCDYIWITKLKSQVPDVQLEYVGVDINESACKAAEKKLSGLDLLKVATYCQDVDESIPEENFDLVLSASSFYYMKHPEKVLELCRKVIRPQGTMIIGLGERKAALELFSRFWYRQFGYEVCFPLLLSSTLKKLDISFTDEQFKLKLSVQNALQDGFSKESQMNIMRTFTQVDVFSYPANIQDVCIKYLEAISHSLPSGDKIIEGYYHILYLYNF